jgi:WD40 repeat protein
VADDRGRLEVWPIDADSERREIVRERSGIEDVALSPDGRILAIALFQGGVVVKSLPHAATLSVLPHVHAVTGVSFDAAGEHLATACLDGKVRIWATADLSAAPRVLRGDLEGLSHVEFTPDGRHLMTLSHEDGAHLWHSDRAGEPIRIPAPETEVVRRAHLSPDGNWILIQADMAVYLLPLQWDMLRAALLQRTHVRLTSDERTIYLGEPAR